MARYLLSSLLAFIGGHMFNYTVILYLQERVGSDGLAGLGFGLAFGSSIVFGWFTGALCDRVPPGRLIVLAQSLFLAALGGLLLAETAIGQSHRAGVVLLSAFTGGLGWSFFGPARLATLGQMAPVEQRRQAAQLFNLQVLLGFGLAPLLIGQIRQHHEWPAVIATAMGCILASSVLLIGLRTRAALSDPPAFLVSIGDGLRATVARPSLRQLLLCAMLAFALTGPMQILLPRLARDQLQFDEAQRGGFLGLLAVSLIVGGVLAIPLARRLHHGRSIFGLLASGGILFALLSATRSATLALSLLFLIGTGGGIAVSLVLAGIQAEAPENQRGRVMGYYSMISQIVPAASGVFAGALLSAGSLGMALQIAGSGVAALAMLGAWRLTAARNRTGAH